MIENLNFRNYKNNKRSCVQETFCSCQGQILLHQSHLSGSEIVCKQSSKQMKDERWLTSPDPPHFPLKTPGFLRSMPSSLRKEYLGSSTKKFDIFLQFSNDLVEAESVRSLPCFVVRITAADCTCGENLRKIKLDIFFQFGRLWSKFFISL